MKRRDFLRTGSAIIVSFAFDGAFSRTMPAQTSDLGKPVDPREVDSFLAIHPDGSVTIYTSKVDVGTGLRIAISQMVAEELLIEPDRPALLVGLDDVPEPLLGVGVEACARRGPQEAALLHGALEVHALGCLLGHPFSVRAAAEALLEARAVAILDAIPQLPDALRPGGHYFAAFSCI